MSSIASFAALNLGVLERKKAIPALRPRPGADARRGHTASGSRPDCTNRWALWGERRGDRHVIVKRKEKRGRREPVRTEEQSDQRSTPAGDR